MEGDGRGRRRPILKIKILILIFEIYHSVGQSYKHSCGLQH